MYIELPQGRLKLFGTLVFPHQKYMVLKLGAGEALAEDLFESLVSMDPSTAETGISPPKNQCFGVVKWAKKSPKVSKLGVFYHFQQCYRSTPESRLVCQEGVGRTPGGSLPYHSRSLSSALA